MTYTFPALEPARLIHALTRAGDALARLDERTERSPIKDGFLERQDFHEAVSSLWIDGELAHMEDLVLHDARMDVRAPTNEIVSAHRILRCRRLIRGHSRQWALGQEGLSFLSGKGRSGSHAPEKAALSAADGETDPDDQDFEEDGLSRELAKMDTLLARTDAAVKDAVRQGSSSRPAADDVHFGASEGDDDEGLAVWQKLLDKSADHPPLLQAAMMLDAWRELNVLERSAWLGRQLAAAILRDRGMTHLPALSIGLRAVSRERRHSRQQDERLLALLDAIGEAAQAGLKEHDRLLNGKSRMERRLTGRRSNSRLPDLIKLVLARPVVSTSMIVKELGTTPQGAVGLANQLELREVTGRGRFRAWGIF